MHVFFYDDWIPKLETGPPIQETRSSQPTADEGLPNKSSTTEQLPNVGEAATKHVTSEPEPRRRFVRWLKIYRPIYNFRIILVVSSPSFTTTQPQNVWQGRAGAEGEACRAGREVSPSLFDSYHGCLSFFHHVPSQLCRQRGVLHISVFSSLFFYNHKCLGKWRTGAGVTGNLAGKRGVCPFLFPIYLCFLLCL